MRVKKYVAKNMKEALAMVKQELGPDAVILAARDVKRGAGLNEVEVTAAVSESTLHKKKFAESKMDTDTRERFRATGARTQKNIIEKVVDRRLAQNARRSPLAQILGVDGQAESAVTSLKRGVTAMSYIDITDDDEVQVSRPRQVSKPSPEAPPTSPDQLSQRSLGRIRNAAKEAFSAGMNALETNEDFRLKRIKPAEPAMKVNDQVTQVENLRAEIVRLQSLLKNNERPMTAVHSHPGAEYGIHFEMSFMFQKLLESGVNAELASQILLQGQKEIDPIQLKKRALVDAYVARWFLTNTKVVGDSFHGRTHVFVGPAGSGKTSMLVKWASYLSLKKKKRVAILTTDAQKVGAVDQLKIYAQILNVPFVVIRSQSDYAAVLTQLAHVDHFLVDTAGVQLKDLTEIDLLRSILPPPDMAAITHLVLNCIAKDSDSLDNCKRFRLANYQDLIFTNLDQSIQHGVIVNVSRALNIPLNSFGIGNSIPEDFEEATKERILDLIFKLTRIQRGVNGHAN